MKESTVDEYKKAVNRVVDYINSHLYENPNLKTLSDIANISEFHFHRLFKAIVGENIGEYVMRLRLEDIAQRLRMSNVSLDDMALKSGYATKYALSKAFKKHFGIAPSLYRKQSHGDSFFKKVDKQKIMELVPEVKIIEPKELVYTRIIDYYGAQESYKAAWEKLYKYGKEKKLIDSDTEYIGLCFDDPTITNSDKCRFYACLTIQRKIEAQGAFGIYKIEGGLHAVFTLKGAYSGLLDLYFNIYMKWLPTSNYRLGKMSCFEKYLNNPDYVSECELLTEIYVPVILKINN